MEEEFENNDIEPMIKLKEKGNLIRYVTKLLCILSENTAVYTNLGRLGKRFRNKSVRTLYKDYKRGLSQINRKIPVYVELPKYQKEGDNMYSKTKVNNEKEFVVNLPDIPSERENKKVENEKRSVITYEEDKT